MATTIERLSHTELLRVRAELAEVLLDAVRGGSSLGFLLPFTAHEATAWWTALAPDVAAGRLAVWVARDGGAVVGTVGLAHPGKPNGRHRAEVVKLIVHRRARGRGLGRALLAAVEHAAAEAGITLLHLDTQTGSPAERLYRTAGWIPVGVVPDYAADTDGVLRAATFFYKALVPGAAPAAGLSPGRPRRGPVGQGSGAPDMTTGRPDHRCGGGGGP